MFNNLSDKIKIIIHLLKLSTTLALACIEYKSIHNQDFSEKIKGAYRQVLSAKHTHRK